MVDKSLHKGAHKSSPKKENLIQEYHCSRLKHVFCVCVCAVGSGPHENMVTTTKQKVQRAILYKKYKISLTFFVPEKRFLLSFFITVFRNKFSSCIILHLQGI